MIQYNLILDMDGIFTKPSFTYDKYGKCLKHFGSNDSLMLKLFIEEVIEKRAYVKNVSIMSGDRNQGLAISVARLLDLGLVDRLFSFGNEEKYAAIKELTVGPTIYVGDDIYDLPIFEEVAIAATVASAPAALKAKADYVSDQDGGEGALADILWWLMTVKFGISVPQVIEAKCCSSEVRQRVMLKANEVRKRFNQAWEGKDEG